MKMARIAAEKASRPTRSRVLARPRVWPRSGNGQEQTSGQGQDNNGQSGSGLAPVPVAVSNRSTHQSA